MTKNKLSFTKLSTFEECGLKYKLHYVDKLRQVKLKSPLAFGNAIDQALNTLLETRDLSKAKDVFEKAWEVQNYNSEFINLKKNPDSVNYSKADLDLELLDYLNYRGNNKNWLSLLAKGNLFLEAYNKKVLPKIKSLIAIQKKVIIENEEGDSIEGILDLAVEWEDGKRILMDNKTSSIKYKPDEAGISKQLGLYHYLQKEELNLDAVGFIVINKNIKKIYTKTCKKCNYVFNTRHMSCPNIVQNKRCDSEVDVVMEPDVEIEFIINDVNESQQVKTLEAFDRANYGILNEQFDANESSCIGKFGKCTYYDLCKKNSMEGLVDLTIKKID